MQGKEAVSFFTTEFTKVTLRSFDKAPFDRLRAGRMVSLPNHKLRAG